MGGEIGTGEIAARYSRRYSVAVAKLLGIEGGFVDDRCDRGGATNYGISLRFLVSEGQVDLDHDGRADFDLDMDGDIDGADVRQLTISQAVSLYYRCFWQRIGCDTFIYPIGEMLFDQGVNGGLAAAKKLLQRAINALLAKHHYRSIALKVDGAIGPQTIRMLSMLVHRHGVDEVVHAYRQAAKDRYMAIVHADHSQSRFLEGWLNRADELGRD